MTADLINSLFQVGGAAALALNLRQLWRHKKVQGVHWGPTAFFAAWGVWNLYFFSSLEQWASLCGAAAIVAMNAAWLASLVIITRRSECAS